MTKRRRKHTKKALKKMGELSDTEAKNLKKLKVGQYIPITTTDMVISFEVRLDEDTVFPCERQVDAEILSRLVRIEKLLQKRRTRRC